MTIIVYILAAVVLLGLCIFVHELGHLLGGKMVGIKAEVFSMGYGKGVLKKKIGDTTYQVTLIPFGGYCKFYGDDPTRELKGEQYEFLSAHPLKRIVTVIMGPVFNLIFGIILFFVMNLVGFNLPTNEIMIPEQLKTSVAAEAGIQNGDTITKIDGQEVESFQDITYAVLFSDGKELNLTLKRAETEKTVKVTPRIDPASGRYTIGVRPNNESIIVAGVSPGKEAESKGLKANDELLSIDGNTLTSVKQFTDYVKVRPGKEVTVAVNRNGARQDLKMVPQPEKLVAMKLEVENHGKKTEIDFQQYSISLAELISKGKLVHGDDNVEFNSIQEFMAFAEANVGKQVQCGIKESKLIFFSDIHPITKIDKIETRGLLGLSPAYKSKEVLIQYGFGKAVVMAFVTPYRFIVYNLKGIGMLISGKMNASKSVSGPLLIAKIAGDVVTEKGIAAFIILMAQISIILMVMNLLPIPAVDGSHIVFYTIELIRRKPLNQKVMEYIQAGGILILIGLFILVFLNDINRFLN